MINKINVSAIPFSGKTVVSKKEINEKQLSPLPVKGHSFNDKLKEHQAVKEEIRRVEQLIASSTEKNPNADTGLLYRQLGKLINYQIELETFIRQNISENLKKI